MEDETKNNKGSENVSGESAEDKTEVNTPEKGTGKSFSEKIIQSLRSFGSVMIKLYDEAERLLGTVLKPFKPTFERYVKPYFGKYSLGIKSLPAGKFILILASLLIVNLLLATLISWQLFFAKHYWVNGSEKLFRVRQGSSLTQVANELEANDIIRSAFVFKVIVKLSGSEDNIISRTYLFKNGMSNAEVMNIITDNSLAFTVRFTVHEGMRLTQIGRLCESRLGLSFDEFMVQASSDSLISALGYQGEIKNLEGFLFPDTYFLPLDITEKELVSILFNEFVKKVFGNSEIRSVMEENNYDILKLITLASIVQGETQLRQEMPVIAGVYYNRLSKRMRLEADPTVQYVIPDGPKQRLLKDDLRIDSPYNTYKNFGLPPGPINSPGLDAVKAVVFPEKHDYLFFVATGKGGHKFAETYSEHLRNVEEYRKTTGQK